MAFLVARRAFFDSFSLIASNQSKPPPSMQFVSYPTDSTDTEKGPTGYTYGDIRQVVTANENIQR